MSIKIGQKQAYVNNPIGRINQANLRANHYVKNSEALQRLDVLDRSYGQRPRVEDDANAAALLGVPKLREIGVG